MTKVDVYELYAPSTDRINAPPNKLGRWANVMSFFPLVVPVTVPPSCTRGRLLSARRTLELRKRPVLHPIFDCSRPHLFDPVHPPPYEQSLAYKTPNFD